MGACGHVAGSTGVGAGGRLGGEGTWRQEGRDRGGAGGDGKT